MLELNGPGSFVTTTNNNWQDDPVQKALIEATGIAPTHDLEAAIEARLAPGAYTAVVRGNNEGTGVGLIEIYDLNPEAGSKLGNISTRAFVSTGDDIVIAGFVLGGNSAPDRSNSARPWPESGCSWSAKCAGQSNLGAARQ